jgi:hypothetical protein
MGVRYLVVAGQSAPGSGDRRPLPQGVERALAEQLDLQEVLGDPELHVYRNVSWAPVRAAVSGPALDAVQRSAAFFDSAATADLSSSPPALTDHSGHARAEGPVDKDSTVYLAAASSGNWSLHVAGADMPRTKAFGWANSWTVDRSGVATLSFKTPITRYGLLALQVILTVYALRRLWRWRAEERNAT